MQGEPTPEIMTRIAKLLAKAKSLESMGSVEEAALFSEKVTELLVQYKLDMSDVDIAQLNETDPINRTLINPGKEGIGYKRQRIAWQEDLAVATAQANFCRVLVHVGSNYVTFVGRSSDRQVATYLYSVLVREINRMVDVEYAAAWRKEAKTGDVRRLRGFKASFYAGAVTTIAHRMYAKKRSMSQASEKTAAIVKVADSAVDDWMSQNINARRKASTPQMKVKNIQGYIKGQEFGNSVNLDPRAVTTSGRAAKALS